MRAPLVAVVAFVALTVSPAAQAYRWPLKPFDRQHAIRAAFGDPRYHLGPESALSAFHFGIDIVARDGAPVYSVEPGVVVRRHVTSVTIGRDNGRRFGYWHVRPIVHSGTYVRLHQLIGHVIAGWGHLHFSESVAGSYRNPLRKGAITPFSDHTPPTVASIQFVGPEGAPVDASHASGTLAVVTEAYDTPPIQPPSPWDVARIAPDSISWSLTDAAGAVAAAGTSISFAHGIPVNSLYGFFYAPGTYQNKPHRPGRYLYWAVHALDTTKLPNGTYRFEVAASDTRGNRGTAAVDLTIANG